MPTEFLILRECDTKDIAICLKPNCPSAITPTLVDEIRAFQDSLANQYFSSPWEHFIYIVWYYHRRHGTAKRGLDFNYILNSVKNHQEKNIESYVSHLFDLLFLNYIGLGLPIINCSIVSKKVSGVFQEFFFLNKINFIKNGESDLLEKIQQVKIDTLANQLLFKASIYQSNSYYCCSCFDLEQMKRVIEKTQHQTFDADQVKKIRDCFDEARNSTIARIYDLASTNLKLLQRLALLNRN